MKDEFLVTDSSTWNKMKRPNMNENVAPTISRIATCLTISLQWVGDAFLLTQKKEKISRPIFTNRRRDICISLF
jgi:hypothetical protein